MTGRAEGNRVVVLRPELDKDDAGAVDGDEQGGWSARFGWWVLAVGFGGFLAWAAWAPLDNGVAMPGIVVVTGERRAVDSIEGGVVSALLVAEGDPVRAGQTLVRLDDTRVRGEAQSLRAAGGRHGARSALAGRARWPGCACAARRARECRSGGRLRDGAAALCQPPRGGGRTGRHRGDAGRQPSLASGLESTLAHKRTQRTLLREQLGNLRDLAREGYVPRNRVLELERSLAQLDGDMAADVGALGQTRQQIAELALRGQQRRDAFQREVRTDLAETRVQREQLTQKLATAEFDLAHSEIRAPASGTVVALATHTVGGVVQPGTAPDGDRARGRTLGGRGAPAGGVHRQGACGPAGGTDVHRLRRQQHAAAGGRGDAGVGGPLRGRT
ncbi:biotin/lipoyl-binding protein [Achromobacter insuavis]